MKSSTQLLLGLLLVSGINTDLYSQTFSWAKRAGSYAYDYGRGICTDGANNVYVTGEFENTGYFNNLSVNSRGNHDIFVSKYNSSGTVQWVRRAGGTAGDVGHAISSDLNGNVYVTGEFQVTADFGPYSLAGGYLNDIFIVKYDTYGNIKWARKAGGNESDKGFGVADKYGNVYVTGFYQGSAQFGSNWIYTSGGKDVFLAKYDTNGNLLWVKKFGSGGNDEGKSISIDQSGNVIVAGYFHNTIGFGSTYLTSNGDHDGFVTKFDTNGNVIWARKVAGPYYEVARGVTSDYYGNIYVTGVFCYGARFEGVPINPKGQGDVFIASYTSSGALRWVRNAGSSTYDEGTSIKAEANGNVYLTGRFSGSSVFGSTVLNAADGNDVFIASLNSSGSFRWAIKGGGYPDQSYSYGEPESGLAIALDGSRSVLVTGAYRSDIVFGNNYLSPYYNTDIFVTKVIQYTTRTAVEARLNVNKEDEDIVLSAEDMDGYEYQWLKDGDYIEGANSDKFTVSSPGNYAAVMISGSDTIYTTSFNQDLSLSAVTVKNSEVFELSAYPNPSNGTMYLRFPEGFDGKQYKIEIVNIAGQLVHSETATVTSGTKTIDVAADIPDGVYFIRVLYDEGELNSRIILKRK